MQERLGDGTTNPDAEWEVRLVRAINMLDLERDLRSARRGNPVEEAAEGALIDLAYAMDLPLVATNDLHYTSPEDARAHEVLTGHKQRLMQVAEELHRQYALGFEPPSLDGKIHTLEVRVKREGMTARARRSWSGERTRMRSSSIWCRNMR